jgi:transcriptional regulator with XRE-family HTH domain
VTRAAAAADQVRSELPGIIRAARRRRGLSQQELADLVGMDQSAVSQWERGYTLPSVVHLLALIAVLPGFGATLTRRIQWYTAPTR